MPSVKWELLNGGYCTALEKIVYPLGSFIKRKFPALFSLIIHPTLGPILFDTGYSNHFFAETRRFPYRFYRWITPVTLEKQQDAVSQMKKRGFTTEDIRYIFLSHLHGDHIAGCRDFPQATFICSRIDYEYVSDTKGFHALRRGFVPGLLPDNFRTRVKWVEDFPLISIKERFSPFAFAFDLFSDQSLLAVHLPGHSPGQFGIFLQTNSYQTVFLAADSCWLSQAYKKNIVPHPISNALTSNIADYKRSLEKVHQLSQRHPEILVVPSHCLETWEQFEECNV